MPCTSCLYGKWVEDECAGQFGVFVYLVLCWFGCCAANAGLSICVWYCHVQGHWLSSGPWQESGPIWAFVIIIIIIITFGGGGVERYADGADTQDGQGGDRVLDAVG